MILDNVQALQATPGTPSDRLCHLLGYYSPGDGGGGEFYWDANSSQAPDGGTIFQVGSTLGRWKRLYSDSFNVKWFGATGNGSTDDTTAFRRSIAQQRTVFIPAGNYRITDTIEVNVPYFSFTGNGASSTFIYFTPLSGDKACFLFRPLDNGAGALKENQISGLSITTGQNVLALTGIKVFGNWDGSRKRVTKFRMSEINILPEFTNNAGTCVGIDINGCEASSFTDIQSWADYPLILGSDTPGQDTNGGGDIDVTTFSDLYLVSNGTTKRPCVFIRKGTSLSNVAFNGTQDYALGTHGIYWDRSTVTSTIAPSNILIENLRVEQSNTPGNYSIHVNGGAPSIDRLTIRNCVLGGQNSIFVKSVRHLTIEDTTVGIAYGNASAPLIGLNIECENLKTSNVIPQQQATANIVNMRLRDATIPYYNGSVFPVSAEYISASLDIEASVPVYSGNRKWTKKITLGTGSFDAASFRIGAISTSRTLCILTILASNSANTLTEWGSAAVFGTGIAAKINGSANFFVSTAAPATGVGVLYLSHGVYIFNASGQNVDVFFLEDHAA